MVEIEWSEIAKNDLKEIIEYISQDSPLYGEYTHDRILELVDNLETFPNLGRKIQEIKNLNIREIIFHNYRIIYQKIDNKIEIITIIHS